MQPTLYSYNILKTATKDFHQSNKLGEGGFGIVYKVNPLNNLIKQCNNSYNLCYVHTQVSHDYLTNHTIMSIENSLLLITIQIISDSII